LEIFYSSTKEVEINLSNIEKDFFSGKYVTISKQTFASIMPVSYGEHVELTIKGFDTYVDHTEAVINDLRSKFANQNDLSTYQIKQLINSLRPVESEISITHNIMKLFITISSLQKIKLFGQENYKMHNFVKKSKCTIKFDDSSSMIALTGPKAYVFETCNVIKLCIEDARPTLTEENIHFILQKVYRHTPVDHYVSFEVSQILFFYHKIISEYMYCILQVPSPENNNQTIEEEGTEKYRLRIIGADLYVEGVFNLVDHLTSLGQNVLYTTPDSLLAAIEMSRVTETPDLYPDWFQDGVVLPVKPDRIHNLSLPPAPSGMPSLPGMILPEGLRQTAAAMAKVVQSMVDAQPSPSFTLQTERVCEMGVLNEKFRKKMIKAYKNQKLTPVLKCIVVFAGSKGQLEAKFCAPFCLILGAQRFQQIHAKTIALPRKLRSFAVKEVLRWLHGDEFICDSTGDLPDLFIAALYFQCNDLIVTTRNKLIQKKFNVLDLEIEASSLRQPYFISSDITLTSISELP